MASQEPSSRHRKRGRKSPKSLSETTGGDQIESLTQALRHLHTEASQSADAPQRKRVRHTPAPGGEMSTNAPITRGNAQGNAKGNAQGKAKGKANDSTKGVQSHNRNLRPRKPTPNPNLWMGEGIGRTVKTLDSKLLQPELIPVTSENGFELLCTYNWRDSKAPSIYVPGAPPSFVSKQCPISVPRDKGVYFIDQNAHRVPKYPFEPIFQALSVMDPQFDFTGVDLVTNRNSLRKLLDFSKGNVRDSFRIDVSVIGNTLFLTRHERKAIEKLSGRGDPGFGHSFEKAFSEPQPGLEDSTGHHRVIKYALGNLNCVVRYEVDACCDTNGGMPGSNEGKPKPQSHSPLQTGEDELLASLNKLSFSEGPEPVKEAEKPLIEVTQRGISIPTTRTVEVKTRSSGRIQLRDVLPQLWFGRTPHLRVGMHQRGNFTDVEHVDVAEKFSEWEKLHQVALQKMVNLIREIRNVAKENGGWCVAVYNRDLNPSQLKLVVVKNKCKRDILPKPTVEKFWRKDENSSMAMAE